MRYAVWYVGDDRGEAAGWCDDAYDQVVTFITETAAKQYAKKLSNVLGLPLKLYQVREYDARRG